MKKKIVSFVLAAALALSSLAPVTAAAAEEKVLRISQSSGGVIDPDTSTDCTSCIAFANMYDSLVVPNMDNEPEPSLAESWETSEDGLTWTFKLRQGVKFHDGSEVLASDVVFSTNRLLTLGEGFAYLFTDYIDTCEATDDYTVVFTLKKSFAPFLSILPRIYVLNEDLVMANLGEGSYGEFGDYGKAFLAENDAGSGAYYLTAMKTQDRICMAKFDDYFLEWDENAPSVVEVIMNTETATIRTMMSNGELQISDQWQTNEAYAALDAIDGVSVGSFPGGQIVYLMLNTKKQPTDDVHVRRALAYLIDYQQVRDVLFPGYGGVSSVVSESVFGYSSDGYDYSYDLAKAEEELQQSQYYDALKSGDLAIEVAWIADVPDEEKLALLIQALASQLGVTVNVTKVPWATHVDNCGSVETTPNASVCYMSSDYPEAGAMLYQRFHSDTAGTWQQTEWLESDEVDAAITDALTTLDDEERVAKYAAIEKQAAEECWGIPVAEQTAKHAYCDNIVFPAVERAKAGEPVSMVLGYNYVFRDFRIN